MIKSEGTPCCRYKQVELAQLRLFSREVTVFLGGLILLVSSEKGVYASSHRRPNVKLNFRVDNRAGFDNAKS